MKRTVRTRLNWLLAGAIGLLSVLPRLVVADIHAFASPAEADAARAAFVARMVETHGFSRAEVEQILTGAVVSSDILRLISRPAERTEPWYEYRRRVSQARIDGGIAFMQSHASALIAAQEAYGVPPAVITAILGIETNYGTYPLRHRVLDALVTLAFYYPPRAATFEPQLEDFLLLAREERVSATEIKGSYAGAMGVPQFMPTSYRTWAVDFDGDGRRDIWSSMNDVVGSVAAYLASHGWVRGGPLVVPALVDDPASLGALTTGTKPGTPVQDFIDAGVDFDAAGLSPAQSAALLEMEGGPERSAYWLVLDNFYCITRYNHSSKYAMVVTELAAAIAEGAGASMVGGAAASSEVADRAP